MEHKETESKTFERTEMLNDVEYFKYIFKKTEKIACAVFYVLRSEPRLTHSDAVVNDLEYAARAAIDTSLMSLKSTYVDRDGYIASLRHILVTLESKLRIANAARYIDASLLEVFLHEIDTVYRSLRKYLEPHLYQSLVTPASGDVVRSRISSRSAIANQGGERNTRERKEGQPTLVAAVSEARSRRDRVLDVIRDKRDATIKDIVEVVTDCSEKTIQRELISLIKDNIVVREGDRRWSKYRLS